MEAYRLGTGEVPGSNPGKGDNFLVKISNWIGPAAVAWFVKASVFHSVNSALSANGGSNPALGMV